MAKQNANESASLLQQKNLKKQQTGKTLVGCKRSLIMFTSEKPNG